MDVWSSPHVGIEFVYVSPGEFTMGSPADEPARGDNEVPHPVKLMRGYWMARFPITQAQWVKVMGYNPSWFQKGRVLEKRKWFQCDIKFNRCSDKHPVENISWSDCQIFLQKLCEIEQGSLGTYALPTEAQWEYACRAGSNGMYAGKLENLGWYAGNSQYETHAVGTKESNAWGLYDMHGNVWEWCQDQYGEYPSHAVINPTGWGSHSSSDGDIYGVRVLRGGAYSCDGENCRSAVRLGLEVNAHGKYFGFRPIMRVRS